MMHIIFSTPNGVEYESDATYVLVMDNKHGSFGMLQDHIPVVSAIERGYVQVENEDKVTFISIEDAILEQENNQIKVISESLALGTTKEESEIALDGIINARKEQNRERNIELALAENELKKQIKKSGAGHV